MLIEANIDINPLKTRTHKFNLSYLSLYYDLPLSGVARVLNIKPGCKTSARAQHVSKFENQNEFSLKHIHVLLKK